MPDEPINIETDGNAETIYEETTATNRIKIEDSVQLQFKDLDEIDDGIRDGIEY